MGESLGFEFDKVHIKKAGYVPQAYADQETENNFIRKQLVEVLLHRKSIPMAVTHFPSDDEALEAQKELHKVMKSYYESNSNFTTKLGPEDN